MTEKLLDKLLGQILPAEKVLRLVHLQNEMYALLRSVLQQILQFTAISTLCLTAGSERQSPEERTTATLRLLCNCLC